MKLRMRQVAAGWSFPATFWCAPLSRSSHTTSTRPTGKVPPPRFVSNDLERHKLILAESRYPKELEAPYEGVEQTIRALSSCYRIGVIANQPLGTAERLTRWGLIPFISLCLSSAEEGLEKPDRAIFELASLSGRLYTVARGNDRRPARQQYPPCQAPRLANNTRHARLCAIPVAEGRLGRSRSNRGER